VSGDKWAGLLRSFELAGVLVRFDHVARWIVNPNHGIVTAAAQQKEKKRERELLTRARYETILNL
jgi:hypothetical protein